jgi:hypothetical protein
MTGHDDLVWPGGGQPGDGKEDDRWGCQLTRRQAVRSKADQVTRRQDFEAAHPEARISFAARGWTWTGTITAGGREAHVTAHELREVLDRLEALAAAPIQDLASAGRS